MKVTTGKRIEKEFEPVTFSVTVESEHELRSLYHSLNESPNILKKLGFGIPYNILKIFWEAVESEIQERKIEK